MHWLWISHVNGIVGVNVDCGVVWGIMKVVGAEVGRTSGDEVYSDVGTEVGEGVELEVGGEVDYWYDRCWIWYQFWRCHQC